jgi:hypothetical protein
MRGPIKSRLPDQVSSLVMKPFITRDETLDRAATLGL